MLLAIAFFHLQLCFAQTDLETIPATWSPVKGSISVDTNHYRLGSKSVAWNWNADDTLKVTAIRFNPTLLSDYNFNSMTLCMYNTSFNAKDSVVFQFYDKFNRLRYFFSVRLNYRGWFEVARSYRYDIFKPSNAPSTVDSITAVCIIAPKTGSGQLNFDNINWIDEREKSPRTLMMPDAVIKSAHNYPPYDDIDLNNLTPNIPITTPTASELADLKTIRTSFLSDLPSAPNATALRNANTFFDTSLYRVNQNGTVKGKIIDGYPQGAGGKFTNFTRHLQTFAVTWYRKNTDTVSLNKALVMLRFLIDNGNFGGGSYKIGPYDAAELYLSLAAMSNVIYAKDTVLYNDLSNYLKWQLKFGAAWLTPVGYSPLNTDQLREELTGYLVYPLFMIRDSAIAVQHLRGFNRLLSIFMQPNDGIEDNLKVDGSVFHHTAHYFNYCEPMFASLPNWLYHLRNTQFKPDFTTYKLIRDGAYNFLLQQNTFSTTYGNKGESQQSSFRSNPSRLWRLALLSKDIVGSNYDPKVAFAYNRLFPKNPITALPVTTYPAEPFPSGFYQMNYGTLGLYRKKNWMATIKMLNTDYWGSECGIVGDDGFRRDIYSRYLAYGALDIHYPGGLDSSGYTFGNYKYYNGYDHNLPNGATTILLDLDSLAVNENYGKEYANTGSLAGSLSFLNRDTSYSFKTKGDYGLSAMSFQQAPYNFQGGCKGVRRNTTFRFYKSWFAFDSILVCLGSNIANNDKLYPTATSIFQLTDSAKTMYINGVANNQFPYSAKYQGTTAYQILNPYGAGYYIRSRDTLRITVSKQQYALQQDSTPINSSGNWAKVWLDHGKNPTNKSYEYVVLPSTTASGLKSFADSMNKPASAYYTVKQANANMHYVFYKPKNIQAYAVFRALTNITDTNSILKTTNDACFLMAMTEKDTLSLTLVNPDLNLKQSSLRSNLFNSFIKESVAMPIIITLRGSWSFVSKDTGISITTKTDSTTVLRFVTRYGLPFDAVLKRDSAVLLSIKNNPPNIIATTSNREEYINVYPNPVGKNGRIYLIYNCLQVRQNVQIEIFGEDGKRVYSQRFNALKGENKIMVSSAKFGKGWWMAKVTKENGVTLIGKFLVR